MWCPSNMTANMWKWFEVVRQSGSATTRVTEKKHSINNMLCYNIMLNDAIWAPMHSNSQLQYTRIPCRNRFQVFFINISKRSCNVQNVLIAEQYLCIPSHTRRIRAKRGPASITSIHERIITTTKKKKKTSSVSKNIKGHHAHIVAYIKVGSKLFGASWCDIDEME